MEKVIAYYEVSPTRPIMPIDGIEAVMDEYLRVDFPGRTPSTVETNKVRLRPFAKFIRKHEFITLELMTEYVSYLFNSKQWSWRHALLAYDAISRFFKYLERRGIIHDNPIRRIRRPIRPKGERKTEQSEPISPEQYVALRRVSNGHWLDASIMIGWHTGMSIRDCATLRWKHIDMVNGCIRKPRQKTGFEAIIPFSPNDEIAKFLTRMRELCGPDPNPEAFVDPDAAGRFCRPGDGRSVFASTIGLSRFRELCKKAGIPNTHSFHGFRHAVVSALANSGMNTAVASKVTGHADPSIFAQYVTPDIPQLRAAYQKARDKSGLTTSIDLNALAAEGVATGARKWKHRGWTPDSIYAVKRNSGLKFPDGNPIRFLLTGAKASGQIAMVTPCDMFGKPLVDYQIEVMYFCASRLGGKDK